MEARLDALVSQRHYAEHLLPLWQSVVPRGTLWTRGLDVHELRARFPGERIESLDRSRIRQPVLVASSVDLSSARRAGARRFAYVEHGVGQSYAGDRRTARHPAYAGGDGRDDVSLILAPNELSARRWRERYPSLPVHVIGATRRLPAPDPGSPPLLVVSFHWNGVIPEQRNALAHYRDALPRIGRELPVAGHAHPRFASSARRVFERAGIPFVASLEEVARRASVYAVDNSSTLYELGVSRPVIALDAPWYRRDVEHGLRFWSHVPLSVDDPVALERVARALLRRPEPRSIRDRRERLVRDVIPSFDGATTGGTLLSRWLDASTGESAA